jgi:ATP-dependent RNA helicase DDX35
METGEKTFIRDVTSIEKGWLVEYGREFYRVKE